MALRSLAARLRARRAYRRTVAELNALPPEIRAEFRLDAGRIASLAEEAAHRG